MAEELTLNATIQYEDDTDDDQVAMQVNSLIRDIDSRAHTKAVLSVATSETTINLGGVTTPKWFFAVNMDDTNYIDIKVAASGAIFTRLQPNDFCFLPLGGGAQAPVAVANTAACLLKYFVGNAT